ncbi:uncharacterized protein LOC130645355 [Hydractinia symbiolongicarpus]|uniref:uncharacterized protein LOC130645355 n=1 Tax=Hydractinia symbiolongicarpus TaxID=13093 RepID=UPI00254CC24C|nr:uncharacterized protein LOC130645355 [Hydractinia symbiolongicarpus]
MAEWNCVVSHKQKRKSRRIDKSKETAENILKSHNHILRNYKTKLCKKPKQDHNKLTCLNAHDKNDIRRNPCMGETNNVAVRYVPQLCPQHPSCSLEDKCTYAHNQTEIHYHPQVFKTQLCQKKQCQFPYCFFAHGEEDLRVLEKFCEVEKKERGVSLSEYFPSPKEPIQGEEIIEVIRDWSGWQKEVGSFAMLPCPVSDVFSRMLFKYVDIQQKVREICLNKGSTPLLDIHHRASSKPVLLLLKGTEENIHAAIEEIQNYSETCRQRNDETYPPRFLRYLQNDYEGDALVRKFCRDRKGLDISIDILKNRISVWGNSKKIRHNVLYELRKKCTTFALTDAKAIADAKLHSLELELSNMKQQLQEALAEKQDLQESLNDSQNLVQRIRKVELRSKEQKTTIPKEWSSTEGYEEYIVERDSSEWDRIYTQFISTLTASHRHGLPNIKKITRIENHEIWTHYALMKKHISNELLLWHGSTKESLDSICQQGFNRSYAGMHATAFGEGTYFARDSSYSMGYSSRQTDGTRHMILAKVLVGSYLSGKRGMKDPKDERRRYDSAVNNIYNPSIYVIFKDYQSYPAYVVTFTTDY